MNNIIMDKNAAFAWLGTAFAWLLGFWEENVSAISATIICFYMIHRWYIMWRDDRKKKKKK